MSMYTLYKLRALQKYFKYCGNTFNISYRLFITKIKKESELDNLVNKGKLTVVQYGAEWCGPCRNLKLLLNNLSKEYPNINFAYVDIDELPALAESLGISSIPLVRIVKDKNLVDSIIGCNIESIKDCIDKQV
ncbi:thioredoxin family protein [Cryptosporidium andersoni]|uniref:Thioredoxin family protein n=1 Tax=Cryptosporidium andersoni TaxID=117008 RepID=A0A1J4MQZ4_9CRYT|nr:thioredoxin family protein [Cryptosporidium andersoni]